MKTPLEHLYNSTPNTPSLDETSRYYPVPTETLYADDGTPYSVLQRRILPSLPRDGELAKRVIADERLDLLSSDVVGDGRLFWQLADLNPVLHPEELTETPGKTIGMRPFQSLF